MTLSTPRWGLVIGRHLFLPNNPLHTFGTLNGHGGLKGEIGAVSQSLERRSVLLGTFERRSGCQSGTITGEY